MKMVKYKLIKVLLLLVIAQSSYADFSQNQVRYLSVKDIELTFMNIYNSKQSNCSLENKAKSNAFGYSSPVTGKPISKKPNFNFLNTYMQCLRELLKEADPKKILTGNLSLSGLKRYTDISEDDLKQAIKLQINKLIGPESVIKSYGYLKSEDQLIELIMNAVKDNNSIITVFDFMKEAIYFISLRDEFLSY